MFVRRLTFHVVITMVSMLSFALGSAYVWYVQPALAVSDPEPQECYIWAVDTETDREFLLCPDPEHSNVCYENMVEIEGAAVKFLVCEADNG